MFYGSRSLTPKFVKKKKKKIHNNILMFEIFKL